jgi:hypothetical protein
MKLKEINRNGFMWAGMLWRAMEKTGNGYRKYSLKNTGIDPDIRKDKVEDAKNGVSSMLRRYLKKYKGI